MKRKSAKEKATASILLITMAIGLFSSLLAWGGVKLVSHGERISVVETKEESNKELLDKIDGKLDQLLMRGK